MDKERRKFLKFTGRTIAEGGITITLLSLLQHPASAKQTSRNVYAFIVNSETCIGCGKCVAACKAENAVPDDCYRTWVERYTTFADGMVDVDSPEGALHGFAPIADTRGGISKSFFVPKLCNHCKEPNCVQVCPVGATYVSPEGVVLVDDKHCVSCSYCVQACPYGARFINPLTRTADKCTWCYHRITRGMAPACVVACPVGARLFGKIDDPESPIHAILKTKRLQVLKPETGNEPMTFYLGIDKEVR